MSLLSMGIPGEKLHGDRPSLVPRPRGRREKWPGYEARTDHKSYKCPGTKID